MHLFLLSIYGCLLCGSAFSADEPPARTDESLPFGFLARLGSRVLRQDGEIIDMVVSADGTRLASIGKDNNLILWDAVTGEEIRRVEQKDAGNSVAYSSDGNWIACTVLGRLYLHDTESLQARELEEKQEKLPFPAMAVASAFSPDSSRLAAIVLRYRFIVQGIPPAVEMGVTLWNVETRKIAQTLQVPLGSYMPSRIPLAFSPDGKMLAIGGGIPELDKKEAPLVLLNRADGKETMRLKGHCGGINSLAFSPDGKKLLACDNGRDAEKTVRLWDLETGKEVWKLPVHASRVSFSPKGETCAVVFNSQLQILKVADGAKVADVEAHRMWISALGYSGDGKRIFTASRDRTMKVWDSSNGKQLPPFSGLEAGIASLEYSPDGKTLASRHTNGVVRLWDAEGLKERCCVPLGKPGSENDNSTNVRTRTLSFSPNGKLLATVGPNDGLLYIHNTSDGSEKTTIKACYARVHSVAFLDDDTMIASVLDDKTGSPVQFWSISEGKLLREIQPPSRLKSLGAGVSPDRRLLATNFGDRTLYFFDPATGKPMPSSEGGKHPFSAFVFSRDGKIIASAGGHRQPIVQIWDMWSGKIVRLLEGHEGSVFGIAISPNNRLVASAGSEDKTVRIWDILSGKVLAKLQGHPSGVHGVSFSPDGRHLVTGGDDGTILIWDVEKSIEKRREAEPTIADMNRNWSSFTHNDVQEVYKAMAVLVAGGDRTVDFLKQHVKSVPNPKKDTVLDWIRKLDNSDFTTREQAQKALESYEAGIQSILLTTLDQNPSAELKQRVESLALSCQFPRPLGTCLHRLRAVQVLESLGTQAAYTYLEQLADGAPEALLTKEARRVIERRNNNVR